jgi:hypothetical protein
MPTATKSRKHSGRRTPTDAGGQTGTPDATGQPGQPNAQPKKDGADDKARGWVAEGLAGAAAQARRDAFATAYRCRRQLVPHLIAAGVLSVGLGSQAVVAQQWAGPAEVATVTAPATIALAALTGRKMRRRRPAWARRITIGGLGASAWLTLSTFTGVGELQTGILMAAELALAARWWQTNRIGYPAAADGDQEPDDPDAPLPLTDLGKILHDFEANAACTGGPLPGAKLLNPEQTPFGWSFRLELKPGKQTYKSLMARLDDLAGALYRGVEDLIPEPHPTDRSPAVCRLQVLTSSPIAGAMDFTGPRRIVTDDGAVLLGLGPYADGDGEAMWRLYTPGSMWGGFLLGGTGMGKSRVIENLVISAMSGGDTEFWFIDPQGGGSSPALRDHADWFTGMAGADDALDAALEILLARSEENAVEGWTGFTPSPSRPGLAIVIDECHNVFADQDRVADWAKVAREGRKVGIVIICVSQYPGLETFGGSEPLRSSIMTGNALAMHVKSNNAKSLMAGLDVDPKTLPFIPGYCYLQGNPDSGLRTAPFRNRNTDPDRTGELARRWLAEVTADRPGLERLAVTATRIAGPAYAERHTSNDTGHAAAAARVEAMRAGQLPDPVDDDAPAATGTGSRAGRGGKKSKAKAAPVGDMGRVIAFPAWTPDFGQATAANGGAASPAPTAREAAGEAAAPRLPEGELTDSQQAVLEAIAAGIDRPKEIGEAVGLKHRQVQTLLKTLLEAGYIAKRAEYGRYRTVA